MPVWSTLSCIQCLPHAPSPWKVFYTLVKELHFACCHQKFSSSYAHLSHPKSYVSPFRSMQMDAKRQPCSIQWDIVSISFQAFSWTAYIFVCGQPQVIQKTSSMMEPFVYCFIYTWDTIKIWSDWKKEEDKHK